MDTNKVTEADCHTAHLTPQLIISKKRQNDEPHTAAEISWFIQQFMKGNVKDYQMTAWLMAICLNGMTNQETAALTEAMVQSGEVMDWSLCESLPAIPHKVDKHSTGGVGDKVSLILAPLVASFGLLVPMMAGRGLGHTGGTIDKLEAIPGYRTQYSAKDFAELLLTETNGESGGKEPVGVAIVSPSQDICPADKRMYALRDVTGTVRSLALQTSSIMSKKIAERPDSLVLDVKFGKGSFNSSIEESIELAKSMIQTGELCGIRTTAFITRMDNVLGYTVGNWLEVRECIEIMRMGESASLTTLCWQRSEDLIEVTLALAGQMLVQGGKATTLKQGITMCKEHLLNGKAWKRFKEMVRIQGGDLTCVENYPDAKYSARVYSTQSGWITSIDSMEIGLIGVLLGAGRQTVEESVDFCSGVEFHVRPGMHVHHGDHLATIHTERSAILENAVRRVRSAFTFSTEREKLPLLVTHFLTKESIEHFDDNVLRQI
eukprot:CCRYP_006308-RB/>CCRYP_006308-RB protein AED:0.05 eAED:0.05 QI:294/1/1/1/1/1/3/74/489